ncbi:hypothetical protein EES41_35200 [Streptomyces sp. ADI95-16]|nr:hypothetical protein EES41_35200 [Streptomyces sp. ADI95-16]
MQFVGPEAVRCEGRDRSAAGAGSVESFVACRTAAPIAAYARLRAQAPGRPERARYHPPLGGTRRACCARRRPYSSWPSAVPPREDFMQGPHASRRAVRKRHQVDPHCREQRNRRLAARVCCADRRRGTDVAGARLPAGPRPRRPCRRVVDAWLPLARLAFALFDHCGPHSIAWPAEEHADVFRPRPCEPPEREPRPSPCQSRNGTESPRRPRRPGGLWSRSGKARYAPPWTPSPRTSRSGQPHHRQGEF